MCVLPGRFQFFFCFFVFFFFFVVVFSSRPLQCLFPPPLILVFEERE